MATSQNVCLLGGSGFVGTELASQLVSRGNNIKVLSRDLRRLKALRVVPSIEVEEVDPYDSDALASALHGQDVVINLVGILNPSLGGSFEQAHAGLAKNLIEAANKSGVRRVIQISALHAESADAPSEYLRTKGEAVKLLRESGLDVTFFCPSVIFGNGDGLFSRFANLLRAMPVMPLACADTRFAPVYVGDVAKQISDSLDDPQTYGKAINLCGPEIFTLREIVQYTADVLEIKRKIFGLPDAIAKFQGFMMEFVPGKPFSRDNFYSLQVDSVCEECDETQPTPVGKIVPTYLGKMNRQSRLQHYRQNARR